MQITEGYLSFCPRVFIILAPLRNGEGWVPDERLVDHRPWCDLHVVFINRKMTKETAKKDLCLSQYNHQYCTACF